MLQQKNYFLQSVYIVACLLVSQLAYAGSGLVTNGDMLAGKPGMSSDDGPQAPDSCTLPALDYTTQTWKSNYCENPGVCGVCESGLRRKLENKISLVASGQIRSVEGFLETLHNDATVGRSLGLDSILKNWMIIGKSESLQRSSVDQPRVMMKSPDSEILMTYSSTPHTGDNNHPGAKSVEMILYKSDDPVKQYEMVQLDFSGPQARVNRNPQKCLNCHGTPPHPKWDSYHWAQGTIPFQKDEIQMNCGEGNIFDRFIDGIEARPRDRFLFPHGFASFSQMRQELAHLKQNTSNPHITDVYMYPHVPKAACIDGDVGGVGKGPMHTGMTNILFDQLSEQNACRIADQLKRDSKAESIKYAVTGAMYCMDTQTMVSNGVSNPSYQRNIDDVQRFFPQDFQERVRHYYLAKYGVEGENAVYRDANRNPSRDRSIESGAYAIRNNNVSEFLYRNTDIRSVDTAINMEMNILNFFNVTFAANGPVPFNYSAQRFAAAHTPGQQEMACNGIVVQNTQNRQYIRLEDRVGERYDCDPASDPTCVFTPNFRSREDDLKRIASLRYILEPLGISMDQWSLAVDPSGMAFHSTDFSTNFDRTELINSVRSEYVTETQRPNPAPRGETWQDAQFCNWLVRKSLNALSVHHAQVEQTYARNLPERSAQGTALPLEQLRSKAIGIFVKYNCTQCHSANTDVSLSDIGAHPVFGQTQRQLGADQQVHYVPSADWVNNSMDNALRGHGDIILQAVSRTANDPKRMPFYGSQLSPTEKNYLRQYFAAIQQ